MAQGLMAMTGGGGDSMHTHSLCIRTRMSCLVKLPLPPDVHLSRLCSTLGSSLQASPVLLHIRAGYSTAPLFNQVLWYYGSDCSQCSPGDIHRSAHSVRVFLIFIFLYSVVWKLLNVQSKAMLLLEEEKKQAEKTAYQWDSSGGGVREAGSVGFFRWRGQGGRKQ